MALIDHSFERSMRDAREGSREALGELLESCRAYLLLVANREMDPELRTKVAASDLVQNTFVRARCKFDDFRGTDQQHWRGWIRQILIRDLQDTRRSFVATDKRRLDREVRLQAQRHSSNAPDPAAHGMTPQSSAIADEEAAALEQAMRRLPEHYREVVQLRNWDLHTFDEIGRRTERSAEAARKLWSRAIERLQSELERFADGQRD